MLNGLRGASDNIFFKIFLAIIVLAFALWGIGDMIRGRNDFDIVKFRKLSNITLSSFYTAKEQTIKSLQQNSKEEISDEMLEEMNVDKQILGELISRRMVEAWTVAENVSVSDKLIAKKIKKIQQFWGDQGKFDFNLFKRYIANMNVTEEEFYDNFRFQYARDLLINTTKHFVAIPITLENIIIDHLAEVKGARYIAIDLTSKIDSKDPAFSEEDIQKFYEENSDSFKLPEERSINYLIIPGPAQPSDEEATKQLIELSKKLEDEVASGENIHEIAKNYKLLVKSANGDLNNLIQNQALSDQAVQIFSMSENEVSYPVELKDNEGLILFSVAKITKGKIPALASIRSSVEKSYIKNALIEANIKTLKEFESKVNSDNFENLTKKFGFTVQSKNFGRSIHDENIPDEVRDVILNVNLSSVSSLIILENTAYLAKIDKIFSDQKQAEIIRNTNLKYIKDEFKQNFIDEIIEYFYSRNIPDIKIELLGVQS